MKNLTNNLKTIGLNLGVVLTLVGAPNALMYVSSKKAIESQSTRELKIQKSYEIGEFFQESNGFEKMFIFGSYLAAKKELKKYGDKNEIKK